MPSAYAHRINGPTEFNGSKFYAVKNKNHHNMTWASRWINIGTPSGLLNSYPFLKATLYNKLLPPPSPTHLDITPKAEHLSVTFSTPISLLLFRFLFTFRLLRRSSPLVPVPKWYAELDLSSISFFPDTSFCKDLGVEPIS